MLIDFSISKYVQSSIYDNIESMPYKAYGLVLGTAKFHKNGGINEYYKYRINAAYKLFTNKKVSFLLLSGDNRTIYYNEPWTMYSDLIKKGIPKKYMFLDYAGFRTLDSIIRANKIFTINDFIIITQKFHCERALLIAKYYNINAICFASGNSGVQYKTRIRESLARIQALIDLYITGKKPYFGGKQEEIPTLESLNHNQIDHESN